MNDLICNICGINFKSSWNHTKVCSKKCRIIYHKKHNGVSSSGYNLSTPTVGTIAELKVSTDLLIKGFEVFRSLSPACSCDLAILKNKNLIRVEVRTGYKNNKGKILFPKKDSDLNRQDVFAVVVKNEIFYIPEIIN